MIETNAKGLQIIRTFDHTGLVLATQYLDSKQQDFGSIQYSYDSRGHLQSETSVDGKTTYFFYDQEGLLKAKCESSGQ